MTDVTNAARTNLMELTTQQWHKPTLEIFGVREGMLPEIRSSAEHLGTLQEGPLKGVPVTGGPPVLQTQLACQAIPLHSAAEQSTNHLSSLCGQAWRSCSPASLGCLGALQP